jgi:hypothetical protein
MSASSHSDASVEAAFGRFLDFANALPLWVLIAGILIVALVISLALVLVIKFSVRRLRRISPKYRRRVWIGLGVFLVVYIGLYFGTTTVKSQGHGGMTGPLKVRVFQNERHLIAFYPLYLVERWVRNGSLDVAVYYFNIEFKDGQYPHPWLYNDGVYGEFW